jgi:hypothetical protein
MTTKICKTCGIEKSTELFGTYVDNRNGKTYYKNKCKECYNLKNKDFYAIHKREILNNRDSEKIKASQQKYYDTHHETILIQKRAYNKTDVAKISRKKYYQKHKQEIINNVCEYKKVNRELTNERNRKRRKTDIEFRLYDTVRSVVKASIKRNKGSKGGLSTIKYLDYSIDQLKSYLEKQFEPWMTWNNWGKYDPKTWNDNDSNIWTWQIDHIIPQSDLPYVSMEDDNFKKCWSLENLRPLSAKQNVIEGPARTRHRKAA